MNRRALLLATAALPLAAAQAVAAPPEVASAWPQARRIGQGAFRFLGLAVYDARLWAPAPLSSQDWATQPFALELAYARALPGSRIAERSLDEMRRQGPFEADQAERWLATLRATFPDVRPGDRLTGLHRPGTGAAFHHNGAAVASWSDGVLAQRFFGIWMSPQTSAPALREALFGGRG